MQPCQYCGAVATDAGDLIAAAFGDELGTWEVTPPVDQYGISVERLGARALRVGVPPQAEIGGAIVGCAWTRGDLADVDVAVAIAFERAPAGVAAGFWLRATHERAITVMLWPSGRVSVGARYEAGNDLRALGAIDPHRGFDPARPAVLRARLVRELVTVYVGGYAVGSVVCPVDLAGPAELRVQVADAERATVQLADPCARLPAPGA
jgi:hypothetical protein